MGSSTYNTWFGTILNTVAAQSTATINQATGATFATTDPIWSSQLPAIIEYAEGRIYRELDMLTERVVDATGSVSSQTGRQYQLATNAGSWVTVEEIAINGNVLTPISRSMMDYNWPSNSSARGAPQYYTALNQASTSFSILLGPQPDQTYGVEVYGMQRPAPLSQSNQTTFLTTNMPDLFFAATMIAATQYMRDLGQQSDNPQMSMSWESQYQTLFKSAQVEEARKMYRGAGWTAQGALPESTPPRQ